MGLRFNPDSGEMENDGIIDDFSAEDEYNSGSTVDLKPEPLNIKGYGTKIAVEQPTQRGSYTDEWGDAVSPEYVKDIDETIDKYGYDNIPAEKLGIPEKPSDEQLTRLERWQKFHEVVKPKIDSEATARAEDAKSAVNRAYYGMLPNSDIALMKPEKHAEISQKAAIAYNQTYQHVYDKEESNFRSVFEKGEAQQETLRKEAAKRALEKTPWKLEDTETGLRQYIRVSPSGDVEIKPTNIPNVKDVTANKRTAQSKILRDVGGVLKASVDENGNPVEIDPGTLALIQQRLEEAELPPVKPKYEEPTGVKKMFGLEKKFKGYAFEGEAVEKQGDYSSAEDVRTAYKTGKISKEDARKIIQSKGWKVN
jgi:hypothetical protein